MTDKNLHTKLSDYARHCDEVLLNSRFRALLDEANEAVSTITAAELHPLLDEVVLLDVREPEEFSSGAIPGKTLLTIPRGKLEFMAIERIAKVYGDDAPLVTYCLKGARGALAAYQLQKMGFSNVRNLEGGIAGWLQAGYGICNYLGTLRLA